MSPRQNGTNSCPLRREDTSANTTLGNKLRGKRIHQKCSSLLVGPTLAHPGRIAAGSDRKLARSCDSVQKKDRLAPYLQPQGPTTQAPPQSIPAYTTDGLHERCERRTVAPAQKKETHDEGQQGHAVLCCIWQAKLAGDFGLACDTGAG